MFTDEQKTRIKNSVFALKPEKRNKILQLASLVSAVEDSEDIEYSVMVSYLDNDMDKELDKALNDMQIASFSFIDTGEKDTKIPSSVKIVKDKK